MESNALTLEPGGGGEPSPAPSPTPAGRPVRAALPSENDALQAVLGLKEHKNADVSEINKQFSNYATALARYEITLVVYSAVSLLIALGVVSHMAGWPLGHYVNAAGIHLGNETLAQDCGVAAALLALVLVYFVGFLLVAKPALREVQFRASHLNRKVKELGDKLSERLNAKDASAIASVALDFGDIIPVFERVRRFASLFEPIRFSAALVLMGVVEIIATAALIVFFHGGAISIACWLIFSVLAGVVFLGNQPKPRSERGAEGDAPRAGSKQGMMKLRQSAIELSGLDGVAARLTFETAVCLYFLRSTAPMIPSGTPIIMGRPTPVARS